MSKELDQAIQQNKRLFLLYGQEQFLIDRMMNTVISYFLDESERDLNLDVVKTMPKDIFDLLNTCQTLPFMAQYRVVVLKELGLFDIKDKEAADKLNQEIVKLPDSTVLIVTETKTEKRKKLYKIFQDNGFVKELNYLTEVELRQQIPKLFERYQQKIGGPAVDLLIERVGGSFHALLNECTKLSTYGEPVITVQMINDLITEKLESQIFRMMDAIGEKNKKQAIDDFKLMLKNRESANRIHAQIARQITLIYKTKLLLVKHALQAQIASEVGLHPFIVKKLVKQADKYTFDELKLFLKELLNLEWDYKRGKIDLEIGLETVIYKMT